MTDVGLSWVPLRRFECGPAPLRRWSGVALVEAVELAYGRSVTYREVGVIVGASRAVVQRAVSHGLATWRADEWAVRLGFHPVEVWGGEWWSDSAQDGYFGKGES